MRFFFWYFDLFAKNLKCRWLNTKITSKSCYYVRMTVCTYKFILEMFKIHRQRSFKKKKSFVSFLFCFFVSLIQSLTNNNQWHLSYSCISQNNLIKLIISTMAKKRNLRGKMYCKLFHSLGAYYSRCLLNFKYFKVQL